MPRALPRSLVFFSSYLFKWIRIKFFLVWLTLNIVEVLICVKLYYGGVVLSEFGLGIAVIFPSDISFFGHSMSSDASLDMTHLRI